MSRYGYSYYRNRDLSRGRGNVCWYFAHGACKFGDRCFYSHTLQSTSTATAIQSSPSVAHKHPVEPSDWVNAPEFVPSSSQPSSSRGDASDGATANVSYSEAARSARSKTNALNADDHTYINQSRNESSSQGATGGNETTAPPPPPPTNTTSLFERSRDKSCGVCFEVIVEKPENERRFGLLPNCNHCFCLTCIMQWRRSKQFDSTAYLACPECRITSDFVCPSRVWADAKDDKERVINGYKNSINRIDCKYYKRGRGKCPFGNKCFYKHALPNGELVDVGPPAPPRSRMMANTQILNQLLLLNMLEEDDDDEFVAHGWSMYFSDDVMSSSGDSADLIGHDHLLSDPDSLPSNDSDWAHLRDVDEDDEDFMNWMY